MAGLKEIDHERGEENDENGSITLGIDKNKTKQKKLIHKCSLSELYLL